MSQLLEKSKALRKAQIAYMEARTNDAPNKSQLGKAVGEAAVELDIAISIHERESKEGRGYLRGAQIGLAGMALGSLAFTLTHMDGKVSTILPLLVIVALQTIVTGLKR